MPLFMSRPYAEVVAEQFGTTVEAVRQYMVDKATFIVAAETWANAQTGVWTDTDLATAIGVTAEDGLKIAQILYAANKLLMTP